MYPQSLHTHSPCQYLAASASSSAFWASVFLFPNTEREVGVFMDRLRVGARADGVTGANANAVVTNMQSAEMIAMMLFMLLYVVCCCCVQ